MKSTLALILLFVLVPSHAQHATADRWEADISRFEQIDRADPPRAGAVLFVGSSSIRYWESLDADFPGVDIIRRGFGGSTVRDATRFVGRIVVPYRPRLVVLYAGDNDLDEGRTSDEVRDDFIAFVERVRRDLPDVPIAYIAIKPSPARVHLLDAAHRANAAIGRYARSQRNVHFIDVFTPMLDVDGKPRMALFGDDGLHMNRAGYGIWIERIAPLLRGTAEPVPRTH